MSNEFKAEEWQHKNCRGTKKDGVPVFDGRKWTCSRCECGYVVNDKGGVSREDAEDSFWRYLAHVSFVARVKTVAVGESEFQESDLYEVANKVK